MLHYSHVFETVDKNSIEIWKYQMYFLVMEYEKKTALVPPFSIFQHVFLIIQWIVKHTCFKNKHHEGKFSFGFWLNTTIIEAANLTVPKHCLNFAYCEMANIFTGPTLFFTSHGFRLCVFCISYCVTILWEW